MSKVAILAVVIILSSAMKSYAGASSTTFTFQNTQPVVSPSTSNPLSVDVNGMLFYSSTDTYTAAANGTVINVSSHSVKSFALQVTGTGAAASAWDVRLEGSLDGTNYTQIVQHVNGTNADGVTVFSGSTLSPVKYFRSRCASITLGSATNIVVQFLGSP